MPHIKDYLLTRTPPLWLTIIILLIGLPLLLPFLYILFRAIEVGLGRSLELLIRPRMAELLSNTMLLMVCVTIGSIFLVFGLPLHAYSFMSAFTMTIALSC